MAMECARACTLCGPLVMWRNYEGGVRRGRIQLKQRVKGGVAGFDRGLR